MPAILTHDLFGQDAYELLRGTLGCATQAERDAFLLGNQGPDPLFYLVASPLVPEKDRVGNLMHDESPAKLVASLGYALDALDERGRSVGRAYAVGFLCHYLLDRSVHPLVYAQVYALCDAGVEGLDRSDGDFVHAEIERDLDEMVLFTKTGETVATYRPYRRVLRADGFVLETIDRLYRKTILQAYDRTLDPGTFVSAVKAFRLVQHLFYSPTQQMARVLAPVERAISRKPYSLYRAMSHRARAQESSDFENREHLPWKNPFTGSVSSESFWDIYHSTLAEVEAAQEAFFADGFDLEAAKRLTGDLNFSGKPAA